MLKPVSGDEAFALQSFKTLRDRTDRTEIKLFLELGDGRRLSIAGDVTLDKRESFFLCLGELFVSRHVHRLAPQFVYLHTFYTQHTQV